jgi:methylase of polypeptide subunit release factors
MRRFEGDVATFCPQEPYDLILANPPFVPTPEGIDGTITSNGGPEGNRFVEILLRRLDEFLRPEGRALVYVFQIVSGKEPLVVDLVSKSLEGRRVDLTPPGAIDSLRDLLWSVLAALPRLRRSNHAVEV